MSRDSRDLLYGSVDMLVLRALAWEPMHGYAIARWIDAGSDGVLTVEDAALYKSLHRLERQGLIGGQWGVTDGNRRAKFYHATSAGLRTLRDETTAWQAYAAAVHKLISPA
jgi:transcriptional regulator